MRGDALSVFLMLAKEHVGCDSSHELQVVDFQLTAVQVGGLTIS